MIITLPPTAESGALALIDLVRNPDACEKAVAGFIEERKKCTEAQAALAAALAQQAKDAADNLLAADQNAKDKAEILAMRQGAETRLSSVARRESDLAQAQAAFDAKVKETSDALAAKAVAVDAAVKSLAATKVALEAAEAPSA